MRGFDAFFVMAGGATLLCVPIFLFYPSKAIFTPMIKPIYSKLISSSSLQEGNGDNNDIDNGDIDNVLTWFNVMRPLFLMSLAAVAYQLEYSLNFIFVTMVDPVTFAVADIVRRLAVIVTGFSVFIYISITLSLSICSMTSASITL